MKDDSLRKGYAAKCNFIPNDWKIEPWFFGEMTREETEHLLGSSANPDGNRNCYHYVISIKHFIIQVLFSFVTRQSKGAWMFSALSTFQKKQSPTNSDTTVFTKKVQKSSLK